MGSVYVVEHVHTGEQLALKLLLAQVGSSPEHIERFKREARASARIKSEHVVRVTDSDVAPELNGAPYLVMELLEGEDLDTHTHDAPVPPTTVLEWLRQAARALDKAHNLGLVHRDLKPENLFLTRREDGSPLLKILDFGLVKMVENAVGQTATGEILGTPRYMAPEQARGDVEQIGPGTDRWALALIAYKLLTGEEYWTAKTVHHLLAQIVYEEVTAPSARGAKLGPAFDAWFATSCAREPANRFSSAGEQIEALAEALGAPSFSAPRTSDSGIARPSKRPPPDPSDHAATLRASSIDSVGKARKPSLWLYGAIAGVALIFGLGLTLLLGKKPPIVAAVLPASSDRAPAAATLEPALRLADPSGRPSPIAPTLLPVPPAPSDSAGGKKVSSPPAKGSAKAVVTSKPPPGVDPLTDQR